MSFLGFTLIVGLVIICRMVYGYAIAPSSPGMTPSEARSRSEWRKAFLPILLLVLLLFVVLAGLLVYVSQRGV